MQAKRRTERYRTDPVYRQKVLDHQRRAYEADPEKFKAKSKRWNEENPDRQLANLQRRRARKKAAQVAGPVSPRRVYERDGYICWLCGEPIEQNGPVARRASIDHVIPLTKGGEHSYANIRCAHRGCNSRKNVSIVPTSGPLQEPIRQLRLF